MDTEVITISQRDEKRYNLLTKVIAGEITLAQAAPALGISYRQAKRLKKAMIEEGLKGLVHGNRGRIPANKIDTEIRKKVLTLSQEKYAMLNDTHFTEVLSEREGIDISRQTVRSLRRQAGIKPKQKRRATRHHKRRPRKAAEGMMMLWDGSPHKWFGSESGPCCLMAAIDDATGKALSLRFVPFESSHAYLNLLMDVVTRYGIPSSVYQDMHSSLKRNDDRWTIEEELAGRQEPTQVGSVLETLGIQAIFALSPQAKGRVERAFRTLQDRLVALLELEGIKDIERANIYIKGHFLEYFNSRFVVSADNTMSVWRKPTRGLDLSRTISLSYQAIVGNDNAIRLGGMVIDVPPGPGGRGYAGIRTEVRQLLDGSWRVYYQDKLIATGECTTPCEPIRTLSRRKGVKAALEATYIYMASAPNKEVGPADRTPIKGSAGTTKRAGKGRAIGATKIA